MVADAPSPEDLHHVLVARWVEIHGSVNGVVGNILEFPVKHEITRCPEDENILRGGYAAGSELPAPVFRADRPCHLIFGHAWSQAVGLLEDVFCSLVICRDLLLFLLLSLLLF